MASAYSGYDSAAIRATRPVTFMTRPEGDGFGLRLVPRQEQPPMRPALRGQIDGNGAFVPAGLQREDPRQAFALRGPQYGHHTRDGIAETLRQQPMALTQGIENKAADDERGGYASLSAGWRHPEHGDIAKAELSAGVPVGGGLTLIGSVEDTYSHGTSVRRIDGTAPSLNEHAIAAAAGLAFSFGGVTGPGEVRGEALWGKSGWGGRLAYAERMRGGNWGLTADYRAPYEDTLEAAGNDAYQTRAQFAVAHRIAGGLWGQAVLRATRYGVDGDDHVADTAGASASLRYLADLGGIWGGLTYEFNGDYVLDSHKYQGAWPTKFTPLAIRTYEVHALSASLSTELAHGFWADIYGGYAIDRYGPDGYFAGGDLRYAFAPGWALTLGGGHSQVSTRQGETGAETSAGLKLVFNWGDAERDAPARPLTRSYFSSL